MINKIKKFFMNNTDENVGGGVEVNTNVDTENTQVEQTENQSQDQSESTEVEMTAEERKESFGNLDQAGEALTVESFTKYMQDMKENEPAKFAKKQEELEKKLGELIIAEKVNS